MNSLTRVLCLGLGILVVCFTALWFAAARRGYYIQHYISPVVDVLYNKNEAFVFVRECADGATGPRLGILIESARGLFGSTITDQRCDLIVVHITKEGVQKFFLPNFGCGGGAYPFDGKIYFQRGTTNPAGPPVWQWSGTNFQLLATGEARKISSAFETTDELLAKEGWKETNVWFSTGQTSAAAPLIWADFRITLQDQSHGIRSVLLQKQPDASAVTIDEMEVYKWKSVEGRTYGAYFGRHN